MRIVSLNAWGGQVWEPLAAWVPQVGADIWCLQEVTRAPQPGPEWLTYADPERRLDQRADLLADISALLPQHQVQFCPTMRGTLTDATGALHRSEHGNAIWVARDLAIVEQVQRFVHGDFRADGWGLPPAPRNIQVLRLIDPATGRCLVLAHLHGLRDPAGKGDTPARAAQAQAILAAIAQVRRPGDPLVLMGDLNLLPDSATFAVLARIGLTDLVTTRGHTDTRTSLYPKAVRYADYCLVSPEVRVLAFDLPARPEVSDHRPLILDLAL